MIVLLEAFGNKEILASHVVPGLCAYSGNLLIPSPQISAALRDLS